MSVKVHEPVCEDSAQDLYFWFDHFLGDQLKDEWATAGTGSAVVVDAQTGGIVRLTSGAATGNTQELSWGNIRSLHVLKNVTIEARIKNNSVTGVVTYPIGLRFDISNFIYLRGQDAGNYFIRCVNGGAQTSLDSGIAQDTDYHVFRIEAFPTGEVHFYIDGVETGNSPITTNIPTDVADYLQPYSFVNTSEDVAKSMDIDYVVVRQER